MANNSPVIHPSDGWRVPAQEDQDLQRAVQRSLEENHVQTSPRQPRFETSPGQDYYLVLSLNNQFAPLEDPEGDTAIYIGPPPRDQSQSDKEYAQICAHFDRVHIVQSANLRLMGDNSKFIKMLGPMSIRAERVIRKTGVLVMPEAKRGSKFKYYINLQPPAYEDEAIILTTELSCTKGVLTWHLAMQKYNLSLLTVLGHDDFITVVPSIDTKDNSAGKEADIVIDERAYPTNGNPGPSAIGSNIPKPAKNSPIGAEYSPLRHRSAIERVLQAIQGNDPKLDSAPKVWTYFAVARYFGCAHHERVSGWITAWLCTQNNANFIQCNPEVVYRIAMGIESAELIRDAFSILVGERALIDAYGEYNPKILNPLKASVHGRKLDLLDEDERNRIDHAASSLVSRVRELVCGVCRDMDWLRESPDYAKLEALRGSNDEETEIFSGALEGVREYIRSRIYYVLCQNQLKHDLEQDTFSMSSFRAGVGENYITTYNSLNQPMRMFTKTFWSALQRTDFNVFTHNTTPEGTTGDSSSTRYFEALKDLYQHDQLNGIKTISRKSLDRKFAAVNRILYEHAARAGCQDKEGASTTITFSNGLSRALPSKSILNASAGIDLQRAPPHVVSPLNPESINLSSLAISGHSKHGSDEAGPSTQVPSSPFKRRKTSTGGDTNRVPWHNSTVEDFSETAPPAESTDTVLDGARSNADALRGSMLALPVRPKLLSIVNPIQEGVKRQLLDLEADRSGSAISASTKESLKAAVKPRTGTTVGADFGFRYPTDTDKIPAPVFEPDTELPKVPTTDPVLRTTPDELDFLVDIDNSQPSTWPRAQQRGHNPFKPSPPPVTIISATLLLEAAGRSIGKICSSILHPPHLFHGENILPSNLFDTLLCLSEDEFKYLPLWAGGNDDGTGGVYDDNPVPNLDDASQFVEGFGPGRIHRPYNAPSVSDAGTMSNDGDAFHYVDSSQALSTVGKASKRATDGTQTVMSLSSAASEAVGSDAASVVFVPSADAAADAEIETVMGESGMNDNGNDIDLDDDEGNSSDTDTDMEVEVHDRSDDDDGEDFDDTAGVDDFDDGDDDFPVVRHGAGLRHAQDKDGINGNGEGSSKGKEKAAPDSFMNGDDDFDDFELL
ncbi:hypothetical protein LTR84_012397 [Exophiala bonariae]|uniref:Uncharacterized protein n=1 Tax=Exophiala bonariae TaxID=1690606 RepID=A0AAV9MUF0_9EURO|nr:hypothetical protein LTR84_012397 [Exophiala bonariae]